MKTFTRGKFGVYGGTYVPEILMPAVKELEASYDKYKGDQDFTQELENYLHNYAGRPTPLYFAENLTKNIGGCKIYLKREDLLHGGAHKLNNALGQALLAKKMGKKRIIAETGAGQHGVATAMACAVLGLRSEIYMGSEDMNRQSLNVFRMRLLGARVIPVDSGSKTLKDAINEALRDWATNVENTYYLIGSAVGTHPYPTMVRDFQSIIGKEIKAQAIDKEGRIPDVVVACVGGGSNAIGTFFTFLDDNVTLYGVEAGGHGIDSGMHAASLVSGSPGILHGAKTYVIQDEEGQIRTTHSISAGLDYPAVGPELAALKDCGRVKFVSITDKEATQGFKQLSQSEGIIPALESAHAIAYSTKLARELPEDSIIVVNLSGRGDKDVEVVAKYIGEKI